jgi:hypothetical protein
VLRLIADREARTNHYQASYNPVLPKMQHHAGSLIELSGKAKVFFQNTENTVNLSSISVWEIIVKLQLRKLPLPSAAVDSTSFI